ncbi:isochorismatase family cysteine hydrolase [Kitasatospora sp. NPDC049285]|uniref:isochorismatase family cysteine hydrolase n=1 Tax=Kitasatospora sp. NPDC049285 TaxID=3157096 RepID=UPI00342A735F
MSSQTSPAALTSTVLVVVDVQVGFVNEASAPAVPVATGLLEAWQDAGGASIVASFHNPPNSPYEKISSWTKLRTDAEQALAPGLQRLADRATAAVTKTTSNLFLADGVLDLFRTSGWTDLVVCGIDTDSCVYDTAVGAYHHGITPWVVADACASSGGTRYHDIGLELAGRNLGRRLIVTSSRVMTWLNSTGDHQ